MPLNITEERRLVWPCTDESRALVEQAMGAAYEYGELPNWRDRQAGDSVKRLAAYREAQLRLVRHIAHLEQLADIPGVWINEKNAALSEAEARKRHAEKDKQRVHVAGRGGARGKRGGAKRATTGRAARGMGGRGKDRNG